MLNRRQVLVRGGGILFASSVLPPLESSAAEVNKELVFRTTSPRNGEPPLRKLVQSWITPTKHFYVRSHAPNPVIDTSTFRLTVEGEVRRPMEISLDALRRFPERTTTATLTCAGNRRVEFNTTEKVGGVQWESGAIGNAHWKGRSLADVLAAAEITPDAKHVWFEGLDEIPKSGEVIAFGGSIPIEKAMAGGAGAPLLATHMNDAVLTPDHGFPLRTIVPGYIGARSVKWLGRVVVSNRPSPNHYLAHAYKLVTDTTAMDWAESGPIYRYPINAAICDPSPRVQLSAGRVELHGYALPSGHPESRISKVEVSTDHGKSWSKATLQNRSNQFCWQLWNAVVSVTPKTKRILMRATDSTGSFMPGRVPWNAKGYLQNSWYKLPVRVS